MGALEFLEWNCILIDPRMLAVVSKQLVRRYIANDEKLEFICLVEQSAFSVKTAIRREKWFRFFRKIAYYKFTQIPHMQYLPGIIIAIIAIVTTINVI
jgi:hypothetical protein